MKAHAEPKKKDKIKFKKTHPATPSHWTVNEQPLKASPSRNCRVQRLSCSARTPYYTWKKNNTWLRVKWCKEWREWSSEQGEHVRWSDKSSLSADKPQRHESTPPGGSLWQEKMRLLMNVWKHCYSPKSSWWADANETALKKWCGCSCGIFFGYQNLCWADRKSVV